MRDLVEQLQVSYQVSQRKACDALGFARSSHRYESTADRQDFLRIRLKDLASVRVNYGYRRLHVLLGREGWQINHKRVYRLYTEEGLTMHRRRPKRRFISCTVRKDKPSVQSMNECWSMDFVADQLVDGRRFRILTIVDNFTRESLGLYASQNIRGDDVVDVLCKITAHRGRPQRIQVDNGSEFTSRSMDLWAYLNKVKLDFSRPGKPTDNAFIESFNGKFRAECLNENWFLSLADACDKIHQWQEDYNRHRPHSSLGDLTPVEFAGSRIPSASPTAQLQEYDKAI
jgi:putative transposase